MAAARFVYFDIDDTLLDHRHAERCALRAIADRHDGLQSAEPERVAAVYHAINVRVWTDYAAGHINKPQAKSRRFAELFEAFGVDADPAEAGGAYLEAYGKHWRFRKGAHEAFEAVADRYPVGLLTNGFTEIQRAKLARFPVLADRADAVVISEEFGVLKPDVRLFRHAERLAGTPAVDILYVGDSLRSDVAGGLGAGWQVAWLTETPDQAPEEVLGFSDWGVLLEQLGIAR